MWLHAVILNSGAKVNRKTETELSVSEKYTDFNGFID